MVRDSDVAFHYVGVRELVASGPPRRPIGGWFEEVASIPARRRCTLRVSSRSAPRQANDGGVEMPETHGMSNGAFISVVN